jgi:RTX calcium-binding nonapeptide repeat (4 copies)
LKVRALIAFALVLGVLAVLPEVAMAKPPRCFGVPATKVGTARAETIVGTPRRDVIVGKGGKDAILGRGGRDLICAGRGSDLVDGMAGRDRVKGGAGQDACSARKSAEHQLHIGCELHMTPPPPGGSDGPRRDPTSGLVQLTRSKSPRAPAGTNPTPGKPTCSTSEIDLDLVSVSGAYTVPAYVSVRPYFYKWGASGWQFIGYNDWIQIDNVGYSPDFTFQFMPRLTADRGYWYVGYEWWWWNGQSWTAQTFTPVRTYRSFFGPFPVDYSYCITT